MRQQLRDSILIPVAYVFVGPTLVFLLHIGPFAEIAGLFTGNGTNAAVRIQDMLRSANIYGIVFAIYLGVGTFPALATAEATKYLFRRNSRPVWWHSAVVGGIASLPVVGAAILTNTPQFALLGLDRRATVAFALPLTFVSGFVATALCWLLFRKWLERYARKTV